MVKFYITTAIGYVNDKPHLGHALELIQGDVISRYRRLLGDDVFFLTGTDEHGSKIAKAAEELKINYKEFVETNSKKFKELTKILNISNDYFIRTTNKKIHWPAVYKIWQKLENNGDLYKAKYEGLYCVGHEAFIKKSELKEGVCPDHQTKPEKIEEENYFFRLTKYKNEIKKLVSLNRIKILPDWRKNEVLNLIKDSEDISFSRPRKDLKWGIPVPNDPEHTIYVWADALTNYLSAIGFGDNSDRFEKFWPADIHLIGKDILRFHAIIWPAMLLACNLELPKAIYVHGFITVDGQKMSKTIGNVIDPFYLTKKYGEDPVRYYLLKEIPSYEDGDFSYKKFELRYNSDLANNLGNLISRTASLIEKYFNGRIGFSKKYIFKDINEKMAEAKKSYQENIDNFRLHLALDNVLSLANLANSLIEEHKPWTLSNRPKHFQEIMNNLMAIILSITILLNPFLPKTAEKILKTFSAESIINKFNLPEKFNFKIKNLTRIFPKIRTSQ